MSPATVARPSAGWTSWRKIALLVAVAVSVFGLPYFVPVLPSVSVSYIAGFNNRAAAMLFVAGVVLFAGVTRGEFAVMEGGDSEVGKGALLASLVLVLVVCLWRWRGLGHGVPVQEAVYFLDRQQMLVAGLTPYKQFEFAYGPLLLYPAVWMAALLHSSMQTGYWVWWVLQWMVGTAMMWAVVRGLDMPVRRRVVMFWLLVLMELGAVVLEGSNYTPMRAYAAAFLIFAAHAVWTRTGSGWWFGLAGVLGVGVGIGCSVEQGVGVAAGLIVYVAMLVGVRRSGAAAGALLLLLGGSAGCFALAARNGLLVTARAFGAGGMSFPLMPSPSILLVLLAYVVAGCVGYGVWRRGGHRGGEADVSAALRFGRDDKSVVVPLVLGGLAMMPAALGRCDLFHVGAATPALIVGVAGIASMPALRKWWFPLSLAGVGLLTLRTAMPELRGHGEMVGVRVVSAEALPCDRRYFFPTYFPPLGALRRECVDSGYFFHSTGNVLTPEDVARKVEELQEHASEPMLAYDRPLEEQYPVAERDVRAVRWQELSPFMPRARNAPMSYAPVVVFIREHWTPGPLVGETGVRVWYPR